MMTKEQIKQAIKREEKRQEKLNIPKVKKIVLLPANPKQKFGYCSYK